MSSSRQSEILGVDGKSILLPLSPKSPPNWGVLSSTTSVIPAVAEVTAINELPLCTLSTFAVESYHKSPSLGDPGAEEDIVYSSA